MIVSLDGTLSSKNGIVKCALGKNGVSASKHEGDGTTPAGAFPIREVWYRADRLPKPETVLPCHAITPTDGWADDPQGPHYNQHLTLPSSERHEDLWREDGIYDVFAVIGYNDAPAKPGLGSAIFLHIAREGYPPTDGCVAVALSDLLAILRTLEVGSEIVILGA